MPYRPSRTPEACWVGRAVRRHGNVLKFAAPDSLSDMPKVRNAVDGRDDAVGAQINTVVHIFMLPGEKWVYSFNRNISRARRKTASGVVNKFHNANA
ncbi:hypothetical protein J6590_054280 [Homalodisca vitripennis]|nr:hypothetical protein J6590_054280 [Homalodisca vitripennis]